MASRYYGPEGGGSGGTSAYAADCAATERIEEQMGQSASVTHIEAECLFGFRRRRRRRRLWHCRVYCIVVRTPPTNVAGRSNETMVGDGLAQTGRGALVGGTIVFAGQGAAVRYTAFGALCLRPGGARIARPNVSGVDVFEAHADRCIQLKWVPLRHALLIRQRARTPHENWLIKYLPFWTSRPVLPFPLVHRLLPQLKLNTHYVNSDSMRANVCAIPFGQSYRKLVTLHSEI